MWAKECTHYTDLRFPLQGLFSCVPNSCRNDGANIRIAFFHFSALSLLALLSGLSLVFLTITFWMIHFCLSHFAVRNVNHSSCASPLRYLCAIIMVFGLLNIFFYRCTWWSFSDILRRAFYLFSWSWNIIFIFRRCCQSGALGYVWIFFSFWWLCAFWRLWGQQIKNTWPCFGVSPWHSLVAYSCVSQKTAKSIKHKLIPHAILNRLGASLCHPNRITAPRICHTITINQISVFMGIWK